MAYYILDSVILNLLRIVTSLYDDQITSKFFPHIFYKELYIRIIERNHIEMNEKQF